MCVAENVGCGLLLGPLAQEHVSGPVDSLQIATVEKKNEYVLDNKCMNEYCQQTDLREH